MDAITSELSNLIVPLIVAVVVAALKVGKDKVSAKVPSFLYPIVAFGLARGGSALCEAVSAPCSGNPFDWSPETVQALAVVAVAGLVQKVTKAAKPKLDELVEKVKDAVGSKTDDK